MNHDPFAGFTPDAVHFLSELQANNTRDWFQPRRERFRQALETPGAQAMESLRAGLSRAWGSPLEGKVFRVHRDVRFSRDKSPYNAHLRMSFGLSRCEGSREDHPYWFFSLEPTTLILGLGVHAFGPAGLAAWRTAVADGPSGQRLQTILDSLEAAGATRTAPELKRVPAGFPPDHARAELLRCKGMALWQELAHPADLFGPEVIPYCLDVWKALAPLQEWLLQLFDGKD
jgi:uncharacterized protein (TIGR02453 family)